MPRVKEVDVAYQAICTLTDAFEPPPYTPDPALRIRDIASKTADATGYALLAVRKMKMQPLWYDSPEIKMARYWQVDTAWAILHDDPVPPLDVVS
jgi:hypothetical protein